MKNQTILHSLAIIILLLTGLCPVWLPTFRPVQASRFNQPSVTSQQPPIPGVSPASDQQTAEIKAFIDRQTSLLLADKVGEYYLSFFTRRLLRSNLLALGVNPDTDKGELERVLVPKLGRLREQREIVGQHLKELAEGTLWATADASEVLCLKKNGERNWLRKEDGNWRFSEDSWLLFFYSSQAYQAKNYQKAIDYLLEIRVAVTLRINE